MITSADRVKRFLRIETPDFDDLLADIVSGVSASADSYVGRPLSHHVVTGHRATVGGATTRIVLPHYPVTKVSAVVENATALAATDYRLETAAALRDGPRILTRLSGTAVIAWTSGIVSIDYEAGFKQNPPADLALHMTREAARIFNETPQGKGRLGLASESPGVGATVSFFVQDWLPGSQAVLDAYAGL